MPSQEVYFAEPPTHDQAQHRSQEHWQQQEPSGTKKDVESKADVTKAFPAQPVRTDQQHESQGDRNGNGESASSHCRGDNPLGDQNRRSNGRNLPAGERAISQPCVGLFSKCAVRGVHCRSGPFCSTRNRKGLPMSCKV